MLPPLGKKAVWAAWSSLIVVVAPTPVHGHALWQQTVRSLDAGRDGVGVDALTTLFTFAEKPGLAQAEDPRMSGMAYAKGVYAYMRGTKDEYAPLLELVPYRAGRFLAAPVPPCDDPSYALEAFFVSGLWAGEDGQDPPALSVFYTSAPRTLGGGDFHRQNDRVNGASHNKFRVNLSVVDHDHDNDDQASDEEAYYQDMCQQRGNTCMAATVVFDEEPLFYSTEVTIVDGDTGETLLTAKTDNTGDGTAYFTVPTATTQRVFAKVSHQVAAPNSRTNDGQAYDLITYHATTVLELTDRRPDYPDTAIVTPEQKAQAVGGGSTTPSTKSFSDEVGEVGFAIIGALLCISFVAGVVSVKLVDKLSAFRYGDVPLMISERPVTNISLVDDAEDQQEHNTLEMEEDPLGMDDPLDADDGETPNHII